MWKQKLKICGINLAAYIVVLIIMAMLSVCSRLYGQEKPMLSLNIPNGLHRALTPPNCRLLNMESHFCLHILVSFTRSLKCF